MPQQSLIPTTTIVESNELEVSILTYYDENDYECSGEGFHTQKPDIQYVKIFQQKGTLNGISFKHGEVGIVVKNEPLLIKVWINERGELIIRSNDSKKYYIDSEGYLIYDFCDDLCNDLYVEAGYVEEGYVEGGCN